MSRRRPSSHRAFTLVELIAAITVLSALGSIVSFVLGSAVDSYTRAATMAQLQSELSIALDRLDQIVRFIPRAGSSGPDISALTATSMSWETDWSLTLSGDQLLLVENGGASSVLLDDVSALSIQAFDESNAAMSASLSGAACSPIRRIRISVTQQRTGVSETMRTKIFLRSQMTGVEG